MKNAEEEEADPKLDGVAAELLWSHAATLDAVGALNESVGMMGELDELRFRTLLSALAAVRNHLQQASTPSTRPIAMDPTPKRLEFALSCHLISCRMARRSSELVAVVDVGAHRGVFTALASEVGATVSALEPNPTLFTELKARFASNDQVNCLPFAAGASSTKALLHLAANGKEGSPCPDPTLFSSLTIHPLPEPLHFVQQQEVQIRTLDGLMAEGSVPSGIYLLKIDAEGHEPEVLEGCQKLNPKVISLEFWANDLGFGPSPWSSPQALLSTMMQRGYPYFLSLFQTPFMSWQSWEIGLTIKPYSYGNLFCFQNLDDFKIAENWCRALLDPHPAS